MGQAIASVTRSAVTLLLGMAPACIVSAAASGTEKGMGMGMKGKGKRKRASGPVTLPELVWRKAAMHLHANDMLAFSLVCKQFRSIQKSLEPNNLELRTRLRIYSCKPGDRVYFRISYSPNEILRSSTLS